MKKYLIPLLFCFSFNSYSFILRDVYKDGKTVCEENTHLRIGEIEKWVSVPINYLDSNSAKTDIYTYTKKPFNQNNPSLIYFTGGPGVSSRGTEFDIPNTNIIYFEQRGISCSRPNSRDLFLDSNFYSSKNTAYDALMIAKAYQLDQVTIYGQSYGTIPATIFASLFPKITRSLILEGVVYKADQTLWQSDRKLKLTNEIFNTFTNEEKNKIIKYSNDKTIPRDWFSRLFNMILYMNKGIHSFYPFLSNLLSMEYDDFKNMIISLTPTNKIEEEFSFGDVMMGMIACHEMSMNSSDISMLLKYDGNKFIYDNYNPDKDFYCSPLHLDNSSVKPFNASLFKVSVPVTYFLGENDGATDLEQGMNHYHNVPAKNKYLYIMKDGGHLSSLSLLKDNRECDINTDETCKNLIQNKIQVKIFSDAIMGVRPSEHLIEEFNSSGDLNWNVLK